MPDEMSVQIEGLFDEVVRRRRKSRTHATEHQGERALDSTAQLVDRNDSHVPTKGTFTVTMQALVFN